MNRQELEQKAKEFLYKCWISAANAYRLYPTNKHTFANFLEGSGDELLQDFIESLQPKWIEIKSEYDLPEPFKNIYFYSKNIGIRVGYLNINKNGFVDFDTQGIFSYTEITHYQIIPAPEKPV